MWEPEYTTKSIPLSSIPGLEGLDVVEEGPSPRAPPGNTASETPEASAPLKPLAARDRELFRGLTATHIRLEDARHRRVLASFVLVGTLAVYAVAILFDAVRGTGMAEPWWTAAGPLAGYVLRVVLEARTRDEPETS